MLDYNEIVKKIFSHYNTDNQSLVARNLGVSQNAISLWLKGERQPSLKALATFVEKEGKDWNWLLGDDRSSTTKTNVEIGIEAYNEKSPPAIASGEQKVDAELIEVLFRVQETLANLGKHLAVGKSADDFPAIGELQGTVQRLQERLAALRQTHGIRDRTA